MSVRWLKPLIPPSLRPKMRRVWDRLRYGGTTYFCPVCASHLREFHSWGDATQFRCPVCTSKPPHRLAYLYFQSHPALFVERELLVHIAPEPELRVWLKARCRQTGMRYRSGGLYGVGDEQLDLRQLPFADQSVRLFYCCHVLNAMPEDRPAMAEIHRVLHPEGVAIIQVPAFYHGETTLETPTREERLAAFHDDAIYRCYTDADYVSRLNNAGFVVEHFRAFEQGAEPVRQMQLKEEVLHVCRRNGAKT